MEDIDQFILNLRMNDAVQNYVKNNVYPDLNTLFLKPGEKAKKTHAYTNAKNKNYIEKKHIDTTYPLCTTNTYKYDYPFEQTIITNNSLQSDYIHIKEKIEKMDSLLQEYNQALLNQQNQCCPICYEKVSEKNKFIGKCDHQFCFDCILTLKKSKHANNDCCPMCRCKIF